MLGPWNKDAIFVTRLRIADCCARDDLPTEMLSIESRRASHEALCSQFCKPLIDSLAGSSTEPRPLTNLQSHLESCNLFKCTCASRFPFHVVGLHLADIDATF